MRISWVAVLAALLSLPAVASRPMTPSDLWAVDRPLEPAVSRDGRRVVFQMTRWDLESGTANTDLWSVPMSGGTPVRLTFQPGTDAHPQWSEDGRFLLFVSSRNGRPAQVFRMPVDGGEATAVTDLAGGVTSFAVGPGGTSLLVAAGSYRDCDTADCVQERGATEREAKSSARSLDTLLYRHWNTWRGDSRSHLFLVEIGHPEATRDLTPGDVDVPPVALGTDLDFTFSRDGRAAVVSAFRPPLPASSTDSNIEWIDFFAAEGPRRVLSEGGGSDVRPRLSADGKRLYWLSQPRAGYEADRRYLMERDLVSGAVRRIFEEPDLSVSSFELLPGPGVALFTAQDKGRLNLYRVDLVDGRVELLLRGGAVKGFAPSPDGKAVVVALESLSLFPELFRLDLESGTLTQLTRFNEKLATEIDLGEPGEYWFTGAEGERTHALFVKPPASARRAPGAPAVIYLIHGGPQGAWLDEMHSRWCMQQFAAFGHLVVGVNFHGSTGYGQRFTDSIRADWGGKPYADLIAGLDALGGAIEGAGAGRVCGVGGSYGGYMVNWLLGHAGDRFGCFVSHAGLFDLRSFYGATEELWFPDWDFGGPYWEKPDVYERLSPSAYAARFATPTLVIHGELDYRVPVTQGMQLFTALQRRSIPSKFLYFPDEGHFIAKPANALVWWQAIRDWANVHLR